MLGGLSAAFDTVRVSPLARRVRRSNLTYLSPAKLCALEGVLRRVGNEGIAGDYLEFGVALGGSAILIASHMPEGAAFHGYDVFGMIPPPGPEDDADAHARYGQIRVGTSPGIGGETYYGYLDDLYDRVCHNFAAYGMPVDGQRVALHRGLFADTLNGADTGPVAFAHIDCDWYEPVRYCLDCLRGRLAPGGHLVLDDYNDFGGCRKAVEAFLADAGPDIVLERAAPSAILRRVR